MMLAVPVIEVVTGVDWPATAAAIGGGAVGLAGIAAAVWTTRLTIRSARDQRIWDKRAETYVDAVSFLLQRNERRKHLRRDHPVTAADFEKLNEPFTVLGSPAEIFALESRLHALGTEDVVSLFKASVLADDDAGRRYLDWIRASPGAAAAVAQAAFNDACDHAQNADDRALQAIRCGLVIEPAQAVDGATARRLRAAGAWWPARARAGHQRQTTNGVTASGSRDPGEGPNAG